MAQLETFIAIKKMNYDLYKQKLDGIPGFELPEFRENIRPNYWFYSLYCHEEYLLNRDEIIRFLGKNSIKARLIWGLICDQKPYLGNQSYKIENARKICRTCGNFAM